MTKRGKSWSPFSIRFNFRGSQPLYSDVFGAPKPQNPRGTTLKVWSPNPTRPRKAESKPTPTSADPKFYIKNPRNPENPRGTSPKCWSPNPTRPQKADPEPDPTPTFAPWMHHEFLSTQVSKSWFTFVFTHEDRPQINISCQNFIVEISYVSCWNLHLPKWKSIISFLFQNCLLLVERFKNIDWIDF